MLHRLAQTDPDLPPQPGTRSYADLAEQPVAAGLGSPAMADSHPAGEPTSASSTLTTGSDSSMK